MFKRLLLTTLIASIYGCAGNGFKKFYYPFPGTTAEKINEVRGGPASTSPIVDHTGAWNEDVAKAYIANGYAPFGASNFNGRGGVSEDGAIKEARNLGADLVLLVSPQYTGTRSSVIPITTPNTTTSYTSGTASAYGSGGFATAYGNSTTTTYGSRTNYIPISTDRYDYIAVYFVKAKPPILGIFGKPLSEAQHHDLGTNAGLEVSVVRIGSPAYRSDILIGDIVLAINGERVDSSQSLSDILGPLHDKTVDVSIIRDGKPIHIGVLLGH